MKNLDQIRAQNALEAAEDVDKKRVNRLPSMIVNNGLLAAAAFCLKNTELESAINAVARHLANPKIGRLKNAESLIAELSESDSMALRLATAEALAYLSFLKRFAKGGK